jgi:NAD(P)-dependent dehydrogenase (short-subunit alcohol dehydrogenase family)
VASAASVATEAGADTIVASAVDSFGAVDILVNNAGLLRAADFSDMTADLWDQVVGVNLRGAFLMTSRVWPLMTARSYGRIVMTTSNSGLLGIAGSSAYASAKAGLWGLTRSLALEAEPVGIRVNAVAPMAYTAMSATSRIAPEAWRSGVGDRWSNQLQAERVSPAVAYLAHESCTLNGAVLSAAGGRVGRFFMGLTPGFIDDDVSPEAVRDRLDEVLMEDGYEVLPKASEEGRRLHARIFPRR